MNCSTLTVSKNERPVHVTEIVGLVEMSSIFLAFSIFAYSSTYDFNAKAFNLLRRRTIGTPFDNFFLHDYLQLS